MKALKYILQLQKTFSFLKKKPNPKPIAISGSLQAPHCAPLLCFGFASELKEQILLSSLGKLAFQLFSSYTHQPQMSQPS